MRWHQSHRPWMTLNGRYVTLAELKYFYEARNKNFNYYVQFQHFERSLMFYSADNVSQIMNLKAVNRYIEHRYFAVIYAIT